jgi:hypothetical protein
VALGLRRNLGLRVALRIGGQHRRQPLGGDVLGRLVTGAGGVLMSADHARIDTDGPLQAVALIATGPQPIEDQLPGAIS